MGVPKVKVGYVLAGRYRLVAPLSRGGMGSVWRAEHLSLGSPIAIKLIDQDLVEHAEPRARFEREARAAAALRSPHVVQILDHGVDKGLPFIAMELLEGESLATRLHRVRTLPFPHVARIFQDVARAMKKAHDLGIIHRDLKPDNIFLVKNDDLEITKVLDFGIAKSQQPFGTWGGATRTGALIGTPQYMSPEQVQGQPIDHTTDLWALGVIAFECLCGRLPFPSEQPGELVMQICARPMPVPSRYSRVPPRFDAWFARACHREAKARFQSAKELSDALSEVLGAGPVSADVSGPIAPISAGAVIPPAPLAPAVVAPVAVAPAAPVAPILVGPGGTERPGPPNSGGHVQPGPPNSGGHVQAHTAAMPFAPPAMSAPDPLANLPVLGPDTMDTDSATLVRESRPPLRFPEPRGNTESGAVMDSDPATLLAITSARRKRIGATMLAAVAALVVIGVYVGAGGGESVGTDVPPTADPPGTASSDTGSSASPEPATSASESGSASAAPSGSASASSSSDATSGASDPPDPPTSTSGRPPVRTGTKYGFPRPTPSTSSSTTKSDTRIGW